MTYDTNNKILLLQSTLRTIRNVCQDILNDPDSRSTHPDDRDKVGKAHLSLNILEYIKEIEDLLVG